MLRQSAGPAAAFLAALPFQLPFFDRWFSFMDEGHLLLYADLIARGGELDRDAPARSGCSRSRLAHGAFAEPRLVAGPAPGAGPLAGGP